MNSTFLGLNLKDIGKAAFVLFVTTFLTAIYTDLTATPIHVPTLAEIKADAIAGGIAAFGYLIKQWLTNSSGQLMKAEPKSPNV